MSAICDHKASETDQTVRRVPEAERGISAVVRLLYELWTTLDHSADAPDTVRFGKVLNAEARI